MKIEILTFMAFILMIPSISLAHPGRTDSSGCHTCRTNCPSWGLSTGEYHCHRSKGATQPLEPVTSKKNENGIGKTVPAPEYKTQNAQIPTVRQKNSIKKESKNTAIQDKQTVPPLTSKKVNEPEIQTTLVANLNNKQTEVNPTTKFIRRIFIKYLLKIVSPL